MQNENYKTSVKHGPNFKFEIYVKFFELSNFHEISSIKSKKWTVSGTENFHFRQGFKPHVSVQTLKMIKKHHQIWSEFWTNVRGHFVQECQKM